MKYFKIIALTVFCMGFVSVYAQQKAGASPERDTGPTTVQHDRTVHNPNDPPNGQPGEETLTTSQQSLTDNLGNTTHQKTIDPEMNPNVPRTSPPAPARTTTPQQQGKTQAGSNPNDDPDAIEPIDK